MLYSFYPNTLSFSLSISLSCSHMGDGQLAALLTSLKIGMTETKDIVNLAKTSNYQLACQKHFEITHPGYLQMEELRNVSCLNLKKYIYFFFIILFLFFNCIVGSSFNSSKSLVSCFNGIS